MTTDNGSMTQPLTEHLLAVLDQVLRQECPYVDRESLGHRCGLDVPWWEAGAGLGLMDYYRLLRQLHRNEVPNIALRVARRSRLTDMRVTGYALLASPNLEHSLRLASHFTEMTLGCVRIDISTRNKVAIMTCRTLPAVAEFHQLLLEEWLISSWRHIQVLLPEGLAACASYATLNYPQPPYYGQYQQLLGARVTFDRAETTLAIPRQWLYIPIRTRNPQATLLLETQVKRLLHEREHSQDIASRVKRLLVERPQECGYSLASTAPLLALSPRTLRRYLAEANTSFRRVCLEVRMELARDYLANTLLTAQEIAYQLGYNQPNNFYRAFKAFFGVTPDSLRTSLLPGKD